MARHRALSLLAAMAFVVLAVLVVIRPGAAGAQGPAFGGSAYGVSATISLFGGAQPPFGPKPVVSLPAGGSSTPVTASDPSEDVAYGPATFFSSGPVSVSTAGTPSGGSTTSSTSIRSATQPAGSCPGSETSCIYGGPFTANAMASTCTASTSGGTASTTIAGGRLVTATDTSGAPVTTVTLPTDPPANDTIKGYLYPSSNDKETFTVTLNERTTNPDGTITVTAYHEQLLGPTAKGDVRAGQAVCGLSAPTPPTTTGGGGTHTAPPPVAAPPTPAPTNVNGSAYGFYSNISLFGGPSAALGPTPSVLLPAGGSASPVTASAATGNAVYGPAMIFVSGPITVSTQGTPASRSVTSSSRIQGIQPGPFSAGLATTACTAGQGGASGSTTITNGTLATSTDANGDPATTVPVPANPPPNDTILGTINNVDGSFKYVFNEQIKNPDGSLTVNAGHEYLGAGNGPAGPALGDLIFGHVVCGLGSTSTVDASAPGTGAAPAVLAATGGPVRALLGLSMALLATGLVLTLGTVVRRRDRGATK